MMVRMAQVRAGGADRRRDAARIFGQLIGAMRRRKIHPKRFDE